MSLDVSLNRRCVSLNRRCVSLNRRCVSLNRRCVSLNRRCVLEWKVCVLEWEGGAVGWCGLGVWVMSVICCLFAGIKKAARRLLFLVSEFSDQNVKNVELSVDTLSACITIEPSSKLPSTLALILSPMPSPVTVNISSSPSSSAA